MPATPSPTRETLLLSDTALAARVGAGDTAAFRCLMERHEKRVTGFACRLLSGDAATAQDVAQDVWISLWQALRSGRYTEQGYLTAYLFRAVRNRCRDLARAARPTVPLSEWDTVLVAPAPSRAVQEAIASLPEMQQLALLLHHYAGASYAEIAETLGCAPGTVASRLHAARANLKRLLTNEEDSERDG